MKMSSAHLHHLRQLSQAEHPRAVCVCAVRPCLLSLNLEFLTQIELSESWLVEGIIIIVANL